VVFLLPIRIALLIALDEDLAIRRASWANGLWMTSEYPDVEPYFDNESDIYDELPLEDFAYDE
jgi:asparagine N-glycosylation enzyme membrane subunit Stt3